MNYPNWTGQVTYSCCSSVLSLVIQHMMLVLGRPLGLCDSSNCFPDNKAYRNSPYVAIQSICQHYQLLVLAPPKVRGHSMDNLWSGTGLRHVTLHRPTSYTWEPKIEVSEVCSLHRVCNFVGGRVLHLVMHLSMFPYPQFEVVEHQLPQQIPYDQILLQ